MTTPDITQPLLQTPWSTVAPTRQRSFRHPPIVGTVLFVMLSAGYFALGTVMILRYNFFDPDGPSRVANAGYAILSRNPHLSAIGFVWNPLPSLAAMPLVELSRLCPELRSQGLAATAQSAMFMAGSAVIVRRIAIDRGLPSIWRWIAIAAFALNPVIVIYGASGMSEAAEVFSVTWATRNLLLWVRLRTVGHLGWAGIAFAVGYLARYEVAFSAGAAAVVVTTVTLVVGDADRRTLWQRTILNVLIVAFPIAVAITLWALTGWITTGDLFATLSSTYGNAGFIASAELKGTTSQLSGNSRPLVIAARLLAMEPIVGIAAVASAVIAGLRGRFDPLVPIATYGTVLAFAAWGQLTGTTFGWFRFYILAIPLVVVVGMSCWELGQLRPSTCRPPTWPAKSGAVLLSSALLVFPVTARAMLNPDIGNQHLQYGLRSFLDPKSYPADQQWYRRMRYDDRLVAKFLDTKNLSNGSVLMDTFVGWGVWLASDDPKQFVVTSDYDFATVLNRPWDSHIRYILVSNPALSDAPDAINLRWPSLWSDGAGFGSLALSVVGPTGQERWRVYEVAKPLPPKQRG